MEARALRTPARAAPHAGTRATVFEGRRGIPFIRGRSAAAMLAAGIVFAGCSAPLTPTPGARNAHGLAFDGRLTLLFGGATAAAVMGDTWGWDGSAWTQLAKDGPPPRTFAAMVSDEQSGVVYLFGGRRVLFGPVLDDNQFLGDLWRWDGHAWSNVGVIGPVPRAESAAAWDQRRRRLIVFGGYRAVGGVVSLLGDTWEFDGARWALAATEGPSPRSGAAMFFDEALGKAILFGGSGARSDTWAWDGEAWHQVGGRAAPGRYNAAATWDSTGRLALRFGGWDSATRTSDTWVWRDRQWHDVSRQSAPSRRNHSAMAFDRLRNRVVLYGGHDGEYVFGDLWEWDASTGWLDVAPAPPTRRVANGH